MKSTQLVSGAACVFTASVLSACFCPDRFRSDHADILVSWGNPKYHIVFEQAELASGTSEFALEFANPPRMAFTLHLILLSRLDEQRLKARNAQLAVEIVDADGFIAYARDVSMHELSNPIDPRVYVRPPDGWSGEPKGNVVHEKYYWQDVECVNGQDVWAYGFPTMGLVRVGRMRLDSKDYTLRITIRLDDADEPPIQFHASLSAGWYASL